MSNTRRTLALAAGLLTAPVVLVALVCTPAQADPQQYHPAGPATASDIVGVGSDTTQYLMNDLADGTYSDVLRTVKSTPFTAGVNAAGTRLVSFDAVNPVTGKGGDSIEVRPGTSIARPDGSSSGIKALQTSAAIDFARSSRGPKAGEESLAFLVGAIDSVSWVRNAARAQGSLTAAQLKGIMECSIADWKDVGGAAGAIKVIMPPAGSGTRSFVLSKLGVADDNSTKACWTIGQENDPAAVSADVNAIAPFSVARFLAPKGADVSKIALGDINGKSPVVNGALNTDFGTTREVYNVVKRVDGAVPARLAALFGTGTSGAGAFLCSAQGQAIVKSNGFGVAANCGMAAK